MINLTEVNENHRAELEEKVRELENVNQALRKLNDIREAEYVSKQKESFNTNLKDRVFIYEDAERVQLIKIKSCDSWGLYNSCNVKLLSTRSEKTRYTSDSGITYTSKDTHRVDSLGVGKTLLATPEDIERIRKQLYGMVDDWLINFKL